MRSLPRCAAARVEMAESWRNCGTFLGRRSNIRRMTTKTAVKVGVFGKLSRLDAELRPRDRVEIYRPLIADPNHPYTRALLAEVPRIDLRRRRFEPIRGEIPSPINPPSGCRFRTRCPYAIDECARIVPELREYEPGHYAACIRIGEPGGPSPLKN